MLIWSHLTGVGWVGGRYRQSGVGSWRWVSWPRSLTSHREMEALLGCDQSNAVKAAATSDVRAVLLRAEGDNFPSGRAPSIFNGIEEAAAGQLAADYSDGELVGPLPVEVSVVPSALRILTPAASPT